MTNSTPQSENRNSQATVKIITTPKVNPKEIILTRTDILTLALV